MVNFIWGLANIEERKSASSMQFQKRLHTHFHVSAEEIILSFYRKMRQTQKVEEISMCNLFKRVMCIFHGDFMLIIDMVGQCSTMINFLLQIMKKYDYMDSRNSAFLFLYKVVKIE